MKVILSRDVAKLGQRFSIIEVSDGFALNKLFPQGLALPATPENLKRVEARAKGAATHVANDEASLRAVIEAFASEPLVIAADANAQDHLFKAVKAADVTSAASARGLNISGTVLKDFEPIKALGTYMIPVALGSIAGTFTLNIVRK